MAKRTGLGGKASPRPNKTRPRLPFRNLLITRKETISPSRLRTGQIDYACDTCGLIYKGPHRGERVKAISGRTVYKGCGVSHGKCSRHMRRFIQKGR